MSASMKDLLGLYAMGLLDGEELVEVERHLEAHPEALAELGAIEESFAALSLDLEPMPLPEGGLGRLMDAVTETNRFESFSQTVADLIDATVERARALLATIDIPESWEGSPMPTSHLIHFDGGPRFADGLTGFVRVDAGAPFPEHTHDGEEVVLILQGSLRDCNGREAGRGEILRMDHGTTHDFVALPGPDLIYLVTLERGVTFDFPFDL